MSNILIIKHGSLGDIAQACGAIQDISENHNSDQIYLLTTTPYFDLFKKNPHLTDVILDKRLSRFNLIYLYFLMRNIKTDENLKNLFNSLKEINSKLWVIEDDKRMCEKNKDFGEKFIKLSRDVHFLNDNRAKIKLEINNHTGSKVKEIKEYTSY